MPKIADASAFKVGSSTVNRLYVGSNLIYPASLPIPTFMSRATAVTGNSLFVNIGKPSGLAVGDLLIMIVAASRSTNSTPDLYMTQSGFTEIAKRWFWAGGVAGGLFSIFAKFADSTDVSTSVFSWNITTGQGAATKAALLERWTNVGFLPDVITPVANNTQSASPQTITGNVVSPTTRSVLSSYFGARALSSNPVLTWGNGAVAEYDTSSGVIATLKSAKEQADSGAHAHTATFTNNQGAAVNMLGTILLKPAA